MKRIEKKNEDRAKRADKTKKLLNQISKNYKRSRSCHKRNENLDFKDLQKTDDSSPGQRLKKRKFSGSPKVYRLFNQKEGSNFFF